MSMDGLRYAGGPFDPRPPREPPDLAVFFGVVFCLCLGAALVLSGWAPGP